ncbi:hypothetical protein C8R45DRAFT_947075 [Mycena sanguinolenta]|nr:hypothetical protein C8R45DRAFT_947075 [Mycena sanguinolenta]
MPPGRPRLPPEIKQEHVLKSRKAYEERNAEKRCEDARLRMQRRRAAIADDLFAYDKYRSKVAAASRRYRRRKREEEARENHAVAVLQQRARKTEEEELRRKHKAIALAQQKNGDGSRKHKAVALAHQKDGDGSWKKAKRLTEAPQETRRLAKDLPVPLQELLRPAPPSRRRADSPLPRRLSEIAQHDDTDDDYDSVCDTRRGRDPEGPIFERRVISQVPKCPHCYEEGCPGCACTCEASTVWITHEGGHFYPTCQKCGGHDCPGCACVCPKATVLIEHGGHCK